MSITITASQKRAARTAVQDRIQEFRDMGYTVEIVHDLEIVAVILLVASGDEVLIDPFSYMERVMSGKTLQ